MDARNGTSGATGMEFPLLNFVQGQVACLGAPQVVVGRTLTLLMTLLAGWMVLGLARRAFGPRAALMALAIFITSPLVLYFGRSVMPDWPAVALALAALETMQAGLAVDRPQRRFAWFSLSAVLMGLSIAVKLPTIVWGLPLATLVWTRARPRRAREWLGWIAYAGVSLLPGWAWYHHAAALTEETGLSRFAISRSWVEIVGDWARPDFYRWAFFMHPFDTVAFPAFTVVMLITLAVLRRSVPGWVKAWGVALLVYEFLAGYPAAHHNYYSIPLVPFVCVVAAGGLASLEALRPRLGRIAVVALLAGAAWYGPWRSRAWFPSAQEAEAWDEVSARVSALTGPDEGVVVVSGGAPTLFWAVDRRGWLDPPMDDASRPLPAPLVLLSERWIDGPPVEQKWRALEARGCRLIERLRPASLWRCPER